MAAERRFHQPGVAWDWVTGVTFDAQGIDPVTGALVGQPRAWSASSKEALAIELDDLVLRGNQGARALLTPDIGHPEQAVAVALHRLEARITSYETFNRNFPGFGGFLPWFRVDRDHLVPDSGWVDRTPSLDNGQLAYSLRLAARALFETDHPELAKRYQAQFDLMARNFVRIFYDPHAQQVRTEARLLQGGATPVERNTYESSAPGHWLDDPYEGLMALHAFDRPEFWTLHPEGRDAIWKVPRRVPATYTTFAGERLTVLQGNWASGHEVWGPTRLPFGDVLLGGQPVPSQLFHNEQKVRTIHAAENGYPGFFASATKITGQGALEYTSAQGIGVIAKAPVESDKTFSPYGGIGVGYADKHVFAMWLKHSLRTPHLLGPYGMAESWDAQGHVAPLLSWDNKGLTALAWLDEPSRGTSSQIKKIMQADGDYETFIARTTHDFSAFEGLTIEGLHLDFAMPRPIEATAMPKVSQLESVTK